MATIQPWYDPTRRQSQSAFLTYWDAFITERSTMNKMMLKQHFEAMDPTARAKMAETLQSNINSLMIERSRIARANVKAKGDIMTNVIEQVHGAERDRIKAQGPLARARMETAEDIDARHAEERANYQELFSMDADQATLLSDANDSGNYQSALNTALTKDRNPSSARQAALALQFIQEAELQGNLGASDDAAIILQEYFPGSANAAQAEADFTGTYGVRSPAMLAAERRQILSQGYVGSGGGGETADQRVARLTGTGRRAPQPGETWNDPGGRPLVLEQNDDGTVTVQDTQTGEMGNYRSDEIPDDMYPGSDDDPLGFRQLDRETQQTQIAIDRQIARQQAQLDRLMTQQSVPSIGDVFTTNYITQPMFFRPDQRQSILDAAAEAGDRAVESSIWIDQTRGPTGRMNLRRAEEEQIRWGGQPDAPGVKPFQISDHGQTVDGWVGGEVENLLAQDDPTAAASELLDTLETLRDLDEASNGEGFVRQEHIQVLDNLIATGTYTDEEMAAIKTVFENTLRDDAPTMSDLAERSIDMALSFEEPRARLTAARQLGRAWDGFPESLGGSYTWMIGQAVEDGIAAQDGRAVVRDLTNIADVAGTAAMEGTTGGRPSERAEIDEVRDSSVEEDVDVPRSLQGREQQYLDREIVSRPLPEDEPVSDPPPEEFDAFDSETWADEVPYYEQDLPEEAADVDWTQTDLRNREKLDQIESDIEEYQLRIEQIERAAGLDSGEALGRVDYDPKPFITPAEIRAKQQIEELDLARQNAEMDRRQILNVYPEWDPATQIQEAASDVGAPAPAPTPGGGGANYGPLGTPASAYFPWTQ